MKSTQPAPKGGTCSRCGECCRWLPVVLVRECKPHQLLYFRERGLKKADGYFLADAPCQHLHEEKPDGSGVKKWGCAIYDRRPASLPGLLWQDPQWRQAVLCPGRMHNGG